VLDVANRANAEANAREGREDVSLGAVKYAFLRQRMGGDIIYDPKESVSLQGNSGPYLQYALARAVSILKKSDITAKSHTEYVALEPAERTLARKLGEYEEVVERATNELMSHHICTYLYELAQVFNRFYEGSKVIGDDREPIRLRLVAYYAKTLEEGLKLLGIDTPEKM
jgi:arginyl-tRNA synthetase